MITQALNFGHEHQPTMVLRYETSADARVRAVIKMGTSRENADDQIDLMLRHYHHIARIRMSLGINEGEPE